MREELTSQARCGDHSAATLQLPAARLTPGKRACAAGGWKGFMSGFSSLSKFALSASVPLIAQLALPSSPVSDFS